MRKNILFGFFFAFCLMVPSVFAGNVKLFKASDQSLSDYKYPAWFRDAKFGIWAHWGPQAVPRAGDWYARGMYQEGSHQYNIHLKKYGHPSKFGYKDIIPLWKAEKFNPEELIRFYKKIGAKYFVSMAVHHDNFFLWDSKLHKWNSVNMGPHRDIVGDWQNACKKEGLYFGVSEHLAPSYTWFQKNKGCDKSGPYANVPYDGNLSEYADLYYRKAAVGDTMWLTKNPAWQQDWYNKVTELIDMYKPDLLYTDSPLPFGHVGRSLVAYYYNQGLDENGIPTNIYTCKEASKGRFVYDVEKGVFEDISVDPWQTDTSIGDWYYRDGQKYKTATEIIQMLVDIVSKNGNLLLNVVQTPEGDLEQDVIDILKSIGAWMDVNGEAIYGTRPFEVYGEGNSTVAPQEKGPFGGFKDVRPYDSTDIRYTKKDNKIYIFSMVHPDKTMKLKALNNIGDIRNIRLLGSEEKISWKKKKDVLEIKKPKRMPDYQTLVFELELN